MPSIGDPFYSAAGSTNNISGVAAPMANGLYTLTSKVTGGVAVAPGHQSMRHRRYDQLAIILDANEPSVEQMIDVRRQQKSILSVQAFVVCGIPPRLTVTSPQVRGIFHPRNAAESLNPHHSLLGEALASTRQLVQAGKQLRKWREQKR